MTGDNEQCAHGIIIFSIVVVSYRSTVIVQKVSQTKIVVGKLRLPITTYSRTLARASESSRSAQPSNPLHR